MNMHTSIDAASSTAVFTPMIGLQHIPAGSCERQDRWNTALARYLAKRAASDDMPIGARGEDEAVDAYCEAMDDLIENVPAPDADAIRLKLDLAWERAADFVGLFDDHRNAILADLRRVAGESEEEIAGTPPRGSHAICEDEQDVFADRPDLRTGRTLEHALTHLSGVAEIGPTSYPEEWCEEIRDVGGTASANFPKDGERHLFVGQICDAQERERQRRVEALCKHMLTIEGMRDRVADFLERRGHYTDDRPRDMRETTAALRDFIDAGYRVFIHPDGRLDTSGGMPKEWVHAGPARAAAIEQAARRF